MLDTYVKEMLKQPKFDRLQWWYDIGPVQRAMLEDYTDEIVQRCIKEMEAMIEGRKYE